MKRAVLLFAVLALLGAVAGCNQSSSNETPAMNTNAANNTMQNAEQGASNTWEKTKSAATNGANAVQQGASSAWNKTTNAVNGVTH